MSHLQKHKLQGNIQIKKKKQTPPSKKLKISKLFIFPFSQSINLKRRKIDSDCFICCLEYLEIIDEHFGDFLRHFVKDCCLFIPYLSEQYKNDGNITKLMTCGITIDQIKSIFQYVYPSNVIDDEYIHVNDFEKIYDKLSADEATIIGLQSLENSTGHIVIIAKDHNNNKGLIDPQVGEIYPYNLIPQYLAKYKFDCPSPICPPILSFTIR